MNPTTAFELILNNPTTPAVIGIVLLFALLILARLYMFRVAMRGAKPADRPAIMRAYKSMWQMRKPRQY
ncbi:hypothetical protein ACWGDE_11170 [Streptomyces sp. NPDC054956]